MSDLFDDEPCKGLLLIMEVYGFQKIDELRESCDNDPALYRKCLECLTSIDVDDRREMVNEIERDYPRFRDLLKRLVLVFVRLTVQGGSQVGGEGSSLTVRVPSTDIFVTNFIKALACDPMVKRCLRTPIDGSQRRRIASDCVRQCLVGMRLCEAYAASDPGHPSPPINPVNTMNAMARARSLIGRNRMRAGLVATAAAVEPDECDEPVCDDIGPDDSVSRVGITRVGVSKAGWWAPGAAGDLREGHAALTAKNLELHQSLKG